MTRKFVFFILSCLFLTLNLFPVFARDPIIIDTSIQGPPVGTGKDYNYHSNDILHTDTVNCSSSIGISQAFTPIQTNVGSSPPTYQTQSVNEIDGALNLDENYTNQGPADAYSHLVGNQKVIFGDNNAIKQSFLSFDAFGPNGSTGMTGRATPYHVLKCQKAQRLIYAIKSLDPTSNLIYDNEQVGWNCPVNQIYSLLQKKDGTGCTPIRLADIAAAIASDPVFYPISVNCNSTPLPDPVPLTAIIDISAFHPHPLPHDIGSSLFDTAVPVVASGSVASKVTVCDKDASNNPVNCQSNEQSIPLGGVLATNQATVGLAIPVQQTIPNYNLCNVAPRTPSIDRPNPLSFIIRIIKFFGNVIDTAVTFTDSTTKTFSIDSRVNIDKDQTFLNNIIPVREQTKNQTTDPAGSSTDSKAIHPGNPVAREVFSRELLPVNF